MPTPNTSKESVLKKYFGYDTFRPLQSEIIERTIQGHDSLVLMPTGGGKSVCFQVPAMVFEGITVVISPLIALMKDQVEALLANGIPAAFINSSLSGDEMSAIERKARNGELKIIYISPEKLISQNYIEFIKQLKVSLFAIDEAHCVSTWGHDFRPEYTKLSILKQTFPAVPLIALTATADRATRKDIMNQLGVSHAKVFISSFDRPNLSLSVAPGRNRLKIISDFIKKRKNQTGIIYCLSRKNTEDLADSLRREGINAKYYHAKMDAEDRNRIQNEFIKDKIQVIVATIAFGMGIDKSNVRWVIHYSLPSNIESFYQEIGRAGRDGMRADTLLFYSYNDIMIRHDMIQNSELPLLMKEVQQAKLDRMKQYAEAEICRRRILLSYFNEAVEKDCGNCDICQNPPLKIDATIIAQKALSAITRTNEKVAMGMLIDILRGSNNKKIIDHRYHELKTFGVGKDLKIDEWADYIQQMLNSGVMDIAYEDAHTFKLNNTSNAVLHDGKKVNLVRYESYDAKKTRKEEAAPKEKTKKEIVRDALFERLRALRKDIADKKDIPAFVVFSDATLADMAQRRPINKSQMMDVSGIGEQKMQQYGNVFIDEIVLFLRENNQTGNKIASKGLTYLETFDLYQKGLSPAEIAQTRNLSETTIFSHLATLFEEGKKIDLYQYITKAEVQTILQAAESINTKKGDAIKPLYDAMDEQYEYYKIRLALTLGNR